MAAYTNEDELKRRKLGKAPADAFEKSMSRTPAILRPIIRGGVEAYKYGKEAFGEAAARPTQAGKIGRGLKAAITVPAAALYGAAKVPAKSAKRFVGAVRDVATEFTGGDSTAKPTSATPATGATRIPTGATPATGATRIPTGATPATDSRKTTQLNTLKSKYGENSGVPGTGYITSASGTVRMGADGKPIMSGTPVGDPGLPVAAKSPERKRYTGRMIPVAGEYRLPVRDEEAAEPKLRSVSDIPEPRTIGGVPGYRRQVEATKADIAAEQADARRVQQQKQFAASQGQQQGQFEVGTIQKQQQFEARQKLDERRVSGTEQQQQLAADQQAAKLAAEQRREGRTVAKEKEISAARAKFEAADTTAEKVAAGQMLNSLLGMKIDTPTKGKSLDLTPKETSQQIQGALKAFDSAGGESKFGTDFYTWMRQNDTRGYQAAFGNLTPKDIRDYARIQELTDEQMMSSDLPEGMNPGETPAQFRQRLDVEYRSKRGY